MVFERILGALEALQAAEVPARLIMPLQDHQPIEFLVDASTMPAKALVARLLRRSMGNVAHAITFASDLMPEHLTALQATSLDLETLRQHRQGAAA